MEDQVASFMNATSATADEARNYLEMGGGNLERAVSLFMDMQCGEAGGGKPKDDDEVRAPMNSFNDQIIGGQRDQNIETLIEQDAEAMASRMKIDKDSNAFNALFAPPGFSDKKPWFECIQLAKESSRWIFVNIQDKEVWESHILNRDVWSDETIVEVMNGSFVFWQRDTQSVEGLHFCHTYKIDVEVKQKLPILCVIDPRTLRLVKTWNAKIWDGPHVAADYLYSFLDKNNLEAPPAKPANLEPVKPAVVENAKRLTPDSSPTIEPVAQRVKEDAPKPDDVKAVVPPAETPKPTETSTDTKENANLPHVDETLPVTQIQVRYKDGSKMAYQFNEQHLVGDLYDVVESVLSTKDFQIFGGFPPKPISDRDVSLVAAGLCQSAVTIRQG